MTKIQVYLYLHHRERIVSLSPLWASRRLSHLLILLPAHTSQSYPLLNPSISLLLLHTNPNLHQTKPNPTPTTPIPLYKIQTAPIPRPQRGVVWCVFRIYKSYTHYDLYHHRIHPLLHSCNRYKLLYSDCCCCSVPTLLNVNFFERAETETETENPPLHPYKKDNNMGWKET